MIPLVPETSTLPNVPPPSMVMALVMVTAPKPPGSRTSISPPAAVLEIAPANVLQGAVLLHGSASLPTPDTHVREACACAGVLQMNPKPTAISVCIHPILVIAVLLTCEVRAFPCYPWGRAEQRPGLDL